MATRKPLVATPGRLDAVLAELARVPRADAQRAIASGRVRVDGQVRPKSFRLSGGERIEADIEDRDELEGEGPPVPVRYRGGDLLVVAKPAGMVTHPTLDRRGGTLVNRLVGMGERLSTVGGPLRPGIVHRLDAGTSGLIVVAQSDPAHEAIAELFRRHEVDRRYLALVRGVVDHDTFEVEAPLGRHDARVVVDRSQGRPAQTRFEVRDRFEHATLLEAIPRTGRTHQIRVHLQAIGHPILGDRRYGGGGPDAQALGLDRPFLHSWWIAFVHPLTGDLVEVEEPLPPDLSAALAALEPEVPGG